MKTIILNENGGLDKLNYVSDFAIPEVHEGEVLVKIEATSVNRADLVIRQGYPGLVLHFPHILGGDITGTVEAVGAGVSGFSNGDRIISWPIIACGKCDWCKKGRPGLCFKWQYFGMHRKGSYAEYITIPESSLISLPDSVSFEQAACLPVAGLTAYHALYGVANLKKGESFFIWGGSSGLGVIAIQLAKHLGATVFATAGTEEKVQKLKDIGADYAYLHKSDINILQDVMKITGNYGIDVVMDFVGPETHPKSFQMVKKGGKILWCGILTGRETMVSMHQTYLRHISLLGLYLGEKEELNELVNLVSKGIVKPYIGSMLDLKEAAHGHELMQEGKVMGKIIFKV